jgi:ABC-type sugar transport system substrate-binding protein
MEILEILLVEVPHYAICALFPLPEGGSVVYLVGEYGGSSTERRKAGFESVIMDHPNLKIVTASIGSIIVDDESGERYKDLRSG